MSATQKAKTEYFHQLHHQKKILLLPNAWDAISAKVFEQAGAKAIGTTSAGMAISLGYPDGEMLPKSLFLETCKQIVSAVNIPVSIDIESGYADSLAEIEGTISAIIDIGAVGINIEDANLKNPSGLESLPNQTAKLKAIRKAADKKETPLFINARTDVYWLKKDLIKDPLQESLRRLLVYQQAGADGVFVPGISHIDEIKKITSILNLPLNILINDKLPTVDILAQAGVTRISIGSAGFRAAVSFIQEIANELINNTNFKFLKDIITYEEANKFFKKN